MVEVTHLRGRANRTHTVAGPPMFNMTIAATSSSTGSFSLSKSLQTCWTGKRITGSDKATSMCISYLFPAVAAFCRVAIRRHDAANMNLLRWRGANNILNERSALRVDGRGPGRADRCITFRLLHLLSGRLQICTITLGPASPHPDNL